jgi:prephenate dehydrogenase
MAVDAMTAPPPAAEIDPARTAAAARLPGRIAFLGFGLIGGSIALALREAGYSGELVAWSPRGGGPREGLRRGLIDDAAGDAPLALRDADLVVLAGPPLEMLRTVQALGGELAADLAPDATITDVVSTKARMVDEASSAGLRFVGGHPMAGRETTGVAASTGDLFAGRPWVIVPALSATPDDVVRVEALATAVGATPVHMTAADHDAAVASISHLPLVVAAALVESVAGNADVSDWLIAKRLAASGWRDSTRLARGDPEMGAGILATNATLIADRLAGIRDVLDSWIHALRSEGTDAGALRTRLEAARAALDRATDE